MTTVTIDANTLIVAYLVLHILYGLVTHYHSVAQVRYWNSTHPEYEKVKSCSVMICFVGRITFGLEWFLLTKILSPIGFRWHLTPLEIRRTI